MLRAAAAIAKVSFQEFFAYRGNLLFEVLGALVTPALSITLWYSLFRISGAEEIKGYTLEAMIAYILCVAVVESILHIQNQGNKQMEDIHEGALNNYLLKPFHPYVYWFSYDMARKAMTGILSISTVGVVAVIASVWIHLPVTVVHTVLAIAAVLVAAPLHFLLFSFVVLFTFWVGRTWGITFILRVSMGLATGALIPLSFFPDGIRDVLLVLPFQFFGYVPVQIFLGRFSGPETVAAFGLMVAWIAILAAACAVVYHKGLRSYGAYGG